MKRILPFNVEPLIKTYGSIGNYLGILTAQGYDTTNILINHYVDIYYAKGKVEFTQRDYVREEKFIRKELTFTIDNFLKVIKEALNSGQYVELIIDEAFVNNEQIHREKSFCHDWLIYGYDDEQKVFKSVGYYGDEKLPRIYGSIDIDYEDLQNGALRAQEQEHMYKNTDLDNSILWIKSSNICETISKSKVKKSLQRYTTGSLLYYKKQLFAITGNNTIKFLIRYHKKIRKTFKKDEPIYIDVRNYRFLMENKKVIYLILKSFSTDTSLSENYNKSVINILNSILLLAAKYTIKPSLQINNRIIFLLTEVLKNEKEILNNFLSHY